MPEENRDLEKMLNDIPTEKDIPKDISDENSQENYTNNPEKVPQWMNIFFGVSGLTILGLITAGLISAYGPPKSGISIVRDFLNLKPAVVEQIDPTETYESLSSTETSIPTKISPTSTQEHSINEDAYTILANLQRNPTGIQIEKGDVINVEYVGGEWSGRGNNTGFTNGCGFYFDDPDESHTWIFPPEQRGASLVGYVGEHPFFVGCDSIDIIAEDSGELFLGMSDCQGCFSDNYGELYVDISVKKQNSDSNPESGPFREHYTVSTGTGPLSNATTSDGMHPFSEAWLWENGHHDIQLINPDGQPDGCGIAKYDVDKIWIGSSVPTSITVDGEKIGYLYQTHSHGYLFDFNLKKGEEICVSTIGKHGYHIIIGPDILYHYDSYCYRWGCN